MNTKLYNLIARTRKLSRLRNGLLCVGAALSLAGNASADVLYDTTFYTDQFQFDSFYNSFIGGAASLGELKDVQSADDFTLAESHSITSVTGDFLADDARLPQDGILVEFFADDNGTPVETPTYSLTTQNYTSSTIPVGTSYRFEVDLTSENIQLGSGTWWLSIVPVDYDPALSVGYLFFGNTNGTFGTNCKMRSGGQDHGNGFPGIGAGVDWGPPVNGGGDLAMRVEGTAVPAPGAMALLGLAGLTGRRRRRRRSA